MSDGERRKIIGDRLSKLRGSRTQKEVALGLGITECRVRHYEAGRSSPKDPLKEVIAKYFKVSMIDLFFKLGEPFQYPDDPDDPDDQDDQD